MLGKLVSDARMAGLVDWDRIVDRGRPLHKPSTWSSASKAVAHLGQTFMLNRWKTQPCFIEVMVEKQALEGVLLPVCTKLGIGFTSNKGYTSMTALYEASLRYLKAVKRQKSVCVLYLGDHDPSGCDMTRDIRERLEVFCGAPIDVKRLALNKSQIEEHSIPPNPAKMSDSRAGQYVEKHGESSWELDAIPPAVLAGYVISAVKRRIDQAAWNAAALKEAGARAQLASISKLLKKHEDSGKLERVEAEDDPTSPEEGPSIEGQP